MSFPALVFSLTVSAASKLEMFKMGLATQGNMTPTCQYIHSDCQECCMFALQEFTFFSEVWACPFHQPLLSMYNPHVKCWRWGAWQVISLCSDVWGASWMQEDAGIGAAFPKVIPMWEGGDRAPIRRVSRSLAHWAALSGLGSRMSG